MKLAIMADMVVAAGIVLYYLIMACRLIIRNFRSLIDLPLAEEFQQRIPRCLTEEFDSFDGLGMVYTRMSGNRQLVQIVLQFDCNTPIGQIDRLRQRLEEKLHDQDEQVVFQIIPLCLNSPADPPQPCGLAVSNENRVKTEQPAVLPHQG